MKISYEFTETELSEAREILDSVVLPQAPKLTSNGFGVGGDSGGGFDDYELREFLIARRWLRQFQPLRRASKLNSSYGLKHRVEQTMGAYISNGVLIAAAIAEGIKVQRIAPDNPNAWLAFKVPGSSVRAMRMALASFGTQGHG